MSALSSSLQGTQYRDREGGQQLCCRGVPSFLGTFHDSQLAHHTGGVMVSYGGGGALFRAFPGTWTIGKLAVVGFVWFEIDLAFLCALHILSHIGRLNVGEQNRLLLQPRTTRAPSKLFSNASFSKASRSSASWKLSGNSAKLLCCSSNPSGRAPCRWQQVHNCVVAWTARAQPCRHPARRQTPSGAMCDADCCAAWVGLITLPLCPDSSLIAARVSSSHRPRFVYDTCSRALVLTYSNRCKILELGLSHVS